MNPTPKQLLLPLAAAGLAFAGCGGSEGTTTVVERTVVQQAPAVASAGGSKAASGYTKPKRKKPKPRPAASAPAASSKITVPNVVGETHQYAQDQLQAAGLYMLNEEDATGQGRMLLWDRNWEVVEQDPPAGTRVSEDTTITLRSKKIGE